MTTTERKNWHKHLLLLGIIWLAGVLCDRLWFTLDNSVPAWDQADYLNGVMNYWQAVQNPQWSDSEWWRSFWLQSSKIPPLTYIITIPFLQAFGVNPDAATMVMLLFSAILLLSVYGLGVTLFNPRIGLWAAGLCQVLPGLYRYRLEFLLDYPLTAVVTFSFGLLTLWHFKTNQKYRIKKQNWLLSLPWAIMFGFSLGLALLLKQTSLFFLVIPILFVLISSLRNKQWGKLIQLLISFFIASSIFYPWYRTNWLLILTSGKRATLDSAIAEGDPALNTIDAWIYYFKILPYLLSWVLLLVPLVGLILYFFKRSKFNISPQTWTWIITFLLGGYFLSSLNINKDARYILPLLPVLSLVLAKGLLSWHGRWQKQIRWGTVGIAILLMILNLFPLGGSVVTNILSPRVQYYPYFSQNFPHTEVIAEIVKTNPYLQTTLGVLPSTPTINQHNFSFYGSAANNQVYGRQVGVREEEVNQDVRSLDWFLTKTGEQGSIPEAQKLIVSKVEKSSEFNLQKTWQLPDESQLNLYHRQEPSVVVTPLEEFTKKVQLANIEIPATALPGKPIPITYQWWGTWDELQSGLVILTWQKLCLGSQNQCPLPNPKNSWLHDHGIGMGYLKTSKLKTEELNKTFQVTETTAMLPDAEIVPGNYTLQATYINRKTGETYPLQTPPINLTIRPNATATPAPELDLVTQFRTVTTGLSQGIAGLEPIFIQTARINQYDPTQDYVKQAEQALEYRLQQQPENVQWGYQLALTKVLQQDVAGAIATFTQLTKLDPNNPYSHAYLAFIYLYDWHPIKAQTALAPALQLAPDVMEFRALNGIASLMGGNLIAAWRDLSPLIGEN